MDRVEALPAVTVAVVLGATLLSGPAGVLDLTSAAATCGADVFPGTGNATVAVVDAPDEAALSKSRFGAGVYRLEVPPATVTVVDPQGRPTLAYRIRIPALATERGSTTYLSPCTTGTREIRLQRASFQPDTIQHERYDARLYLVYRGTDAGAPVEQELLNRSITVEVER